MNESTWTKYRKAIIAGITSIAGLAVILFALDPNTVEAVVGVVIALLNTYGVYRVSNQPQPEPDLPPDEGHGVVPPYVKNPVKPPKK